jgi:DNA phosphorothioation-dependent restriction protein DptG
MCRGSYHILELLQHLGVLETINKGLWISFHSYSHLPTEKRVSVKERFHEEEGISFKTGTWKDLFKKKEPAPHLKSKISLFCDQVCEYNFMRYLELLCCRFELSADKNLANYQEAANSK